MKTYLILLRLCAVVVLLVLFSCKKDKTCEFLDDCDNKVVCEDFPDMYYSLFFESEKQFKAPHFNPNNPDEFVYLFKDNAHNIRQLIKYNLSTQQKTVLLDGISVFEQPKWSKTGWIAVSSGHHIHLVRDNGEDLSQVTTNLANLAPFWNSSGNELYWTYSPDLGSEWYVLRQNRLTMGIDTVSNLPISRSSDMLHYKIIHISTLEYSGLPYYGYFNSHVTPFTLDNFNKIGVCNLAAMEGVCWHPSGLKFYVSHTYSGKNSGLYSVSISGVATRIKKNCDTRRHTLISCSSDGKRLIAERVDSEVERAHDGNPTGNIILTSSIWLINTETWEETKVALD